MCVTFSHKMSENSHSLKKWIVTSVEMQQAQSLWKNEHSLCGNHPKNFSDVKTGLITLVGQDQASICREFINSVKMN